MTKAVRTPATAERTGLVVVAVSVTDIESAGATVGGSGAVDIKISGAVNVHDVKTRAHIDEGARINEDQTSAGADQSVLVAAGRTYHSLAVAGGLSLSGTVSIVPALSLPILTGDTSAYIGRDDGFDAGPHLGSTYATIVNARGDVTVAATAHADFIGVAIGLAGSLTVAIAGSVAVIKVDTDTLAAISGDVRVDAGGHVVVRATDDTIVHAIAGGVGVGLGAVGGAGAAAVTLITKDTDAVIGGGAAVEAGGNGPLPVDGMPTGAMAANGSVVVAPVRGVVVVARSTEWLFSVAISVAGGTALGAAGSVIVGIIDSNTFARIEGYARINQANAATGHAEQSVVVAATNAIDVTTIGGAGGGSIVGVGASVDVLILRSDTLAFIGGAARVRANDAVSVVALSHRDLDTKLFSGGVGGLGLGGIGVGLVDRGRLHLDVHRPELSVEPSGSRSRRARATS